MKFPKLLYKHASYSCTLYVILFPIMLFILGLSQRFIYGSVLKSLFISVVTMLISVTTSWLLSLRVENKAFIHALVRSAKKQLQIKHQPRPSKARGQDRALR